MRIIACVFRQQCVRTFKNMLAHVNTDKPVFTMDRVRKNICIEMYDTFTLKTYISTIYVTFTFKYVCCSTSVSANSALTQY